MNPLSRFFSRTGAPVVGPSAAGNPVEANPVAVGIAGGLPVMLLLSCAVALPGCFAGDGDDDDPSLPPSQYGSYSLGGVLQYDYVPYRSSGGGLNYSGIEQRPIRGVAVYLLDARDDEVLAETVSGEDGRYQFAYEGPNQVKLWVYAQTDTPDIRIEDNTSRDELYVLESETVDATTQTTLDVVASSGWDGSEYGEARASAPFAILDAAYSSARKFLTETTPPPSFPTLKINWSVDNRPEGGDKSDGEIGTSHWDGEELYILGKENVDTDEFDSHVIVHEWGHYFESNISRADSIGGPHTSGDVLDPRVAFGEGWGNALSAIILDPDTVYTDSLGYRQGQGFGFDLEANTKSTDSKPGWYSEESVQTMLFDLYDGANESFDTVALGLQPIYTALAGGQKSTDALTTVFSFITVLKGIDGVPTADVDALVGYHTADATYGFNTIADVWGTGESHTGGVSSSLPLYRAMPVGSSFSVTLTGGTDYNKLSQNRYVTFTGTGGSVKITTTGDKDVDLIVYRQGEIVGYSATYSGNESAQVSTSSGATYVVNVQGWDEGSGSYSTQVSIQ